jgi:hypothetical protein
MESGPALNCFGPTTGPHGPWPCTSVTCAHAHAIAPVTPLTNRAVASHHASGIALATTVAPGHSLPHMCHQGCPYPLMWERAKPSRLSAFHLALLRRIAPRRSSPRLKRHFAAVFVCLKVVVNQRPHPYSSWCGSMSESSAELPLRPLWAPQRRQPHLATGPPGCHLRVHLSGVALLFGPTPWLPQPPAWASTTGPPPPVCASTWTAASACSPVKPPQSSSSAGVPWSSPTHQSPSTTTEPCHPCCSLLADYRHRGAPSSSELPTFFFPQISSPPQLLL